MKRHFAIEYVKRYSQGIPTEESDKEGVHEYVDKPMAIQCKKATINNRATKAHHLETDMDRDVRLDPKALKNELAEDEPPCISIVLDIDILIKLLDFKYITFLFISYHMPLNFSHICKFIVFILLLCIYYHAHYNFLQ